ncbi:MAG: OB-fold domain-containing protein [Neisseriaceae bacterium]|nr:OB-fold domain-containing protein [Neisseriaceae bacterium]MBP6860953.1 OB-fold domain-containing protein [Neisseriaceae bacterium]
MNRSECHHEVRGPEAEYKAYLAQGVFKIQRSQRTGKHVFYPRIAMPHSGETDLAWVDASGLGTIYAITVNRSKQTQHNVALIDLDEGPRLMSRIEGVETAPIGSRVQAKIIQEQGEPLLVFTLIEAA